MIAPKEGQKSMNTRTKHQKLKKIVKKTEKKIYEQKNCSDNQDKCNMYFSIFYDFTVSAINS